jgi:hypothetical protein
MLSVFRLIFKHFQISSIPFHVANSNQNEKKIELLSLVCHGLPENAFQVNQLYNVTWSNVYYSTYLGVEVIDMFVCLFMDNLKSIVCLIESQEVAIRCTLIFSESGKQLYSIFLLTF